MCRRVALRRHPVVALADHRAVARDHRPERPTLGAVGVDPTELNGATQEVLVGHDRSPAVTAAAPPWRDACPPTTAVDGNGCRSAPAAGGDRQEECEGSARQQAERARSDE